jgi:hypothetical protein
LQSRLSGLVVALIDPLRKLFQNEEARLLAEEEAKLAMPEDNQPKKKRD